MKHLLTILEVDHVRDGKVIWQNKHLPNVLHKQGEEYMLTALFKTTLLTVPTFYYLGLDNRTTPDIADALPTGLQGEPTSNGYSRQAVSSASGFTIEEVDGVMRATSLVVSFTASGGTWGPVSNLFLTDKINNTGYLIATAPLGSTRTLQDGDFITMRFALALKDVPLS
jgi:hypothetical protein